MLYICMEICNFFDFEIYKNFINILLIPQELHQDMLNRISFQHNELKRIREEENRRKAEAKR